MRFLYAIFLLLLIAIASSYLVRQLGLFPDGEIAMIDPAVLFVSEPVFRLSCDEDATPADYREMFSRVASNRQLSGRCAELSL